MPLSMLLILDSDCFLFVSSLLLFDLDEHFLEQKDCSLFLRPTRKSSSQYLHFLDIFSLFPLAWWLSDIFLFVSDLFIFELYLHEHLLEQKYRSFLGFSTSNSLMLKNEPQIKHSTSNFFHLFNFFSLMIIKVSFDRILG